MSNRFAEQDFDRRYGAEVRPLKDQSASPLLPCRECGYSGEGEHPYPCGDWGAPLTTREAEILKVATRAYHVAGQLEHIVVTRLGMSVITFWQLVNELIDTERALAFDPVNVNRLRRQRDAALKLRRP